MPRRQQATAGRTVFHRRHTCAGGVVNTGNQFTLAHFVTHVAAHFQQTVVLAGYETIGVGHVEHDRFPGLYFTLKNPSMHQQIAHPTLGNRHTAGAGRTTAAQLGRDKYLALPLGGGVVH